MLWWHHDISIICDINTYSGVYIVHSQYILSIQLLEDNDARRVATITK